MLEDSGDEEETNGIVNQVLDEIGIEISGKVIFRSQYQKKKKQINFVISVFVPVFPLDVGCTVCYQR